MNCSSQSQCCRQMPWAQSWGLHAQQAAARQPPLCPCTSFFLVKVRLLNPALLTHVQQARQAISERCFSAPSPTSITCFKAFSDSFLISRPFIRERCLSTPRPTSIPCFKAISDPFLVLRPPVIHSLF